MIILFLLHLFIHSNGINCNEIKNLTTNVENGILATNESIWHDSHVFYQSTTNQRGKRANTPPRRSRSRSPLRTPGPNDQQRTPPLQLQPGNPFGLLPFQPPPPIVGQPFMPQPIAGQPPPAPIGAVGQMLPPIGGGQPAVGQMPLPLQIMPAAFGPPQQPQYTQHHQPPLLPQNIPQHRSPIAPRPASPLYYELQSLYEQPPQTYSPQRYRNLSPTQRAIFEDILQDDVLQIRNPQNVPPHQSPIAHRPATPRYSPLTPEPVQQQQQPQAGQIRVLAPPVDPAFDHYQRRQQELHEQQFHQGQVVNIPPPMTYEQALQHEQQRRQAAHVQNTPQNVQQANVRTPHVRAPAEVPERFSLTRREQAELDRLYRTRNQAFARAVQRDRDNPKWSRNRLQDEDLIAGFRGLHLYGHIPMYNLGRIYEFAPDVIERAFNERGIPHYPSRAGPPNRDRTEYRLATEELLEHLDRRDTVGSPTPGRNPPQAKIHRQVQNPPNVQEPNARSPHVRAPEIPANRPKIILYKHEQEQLDQLYQRRNAPYGRAVQRRREALGRGARTTHYDDDLIAGFRGLHEYGHVKLQYFKKKHGVNQDIIEREFNARGFPIYPPNNGAPKKDRTEYRLATESLNAHLDRRENVEGMTSPLNAGGMQPQANVQQQQLQNQPQIEQQNIRPTSPRISPETIYVPLSPIQLQNQPHIVEGQNVIPQSSRSSGSSEIIYIPPSPEQQRSSTRNLLQSQVHVHPRRAPTPIEQMQRQLYMRHIPIDTYPHLAHFRMSDRNQDTIVEYFRHARPRNLQNDVEIQQAFHNLAAVGVRPGMLAQHYREQPIDVIRDILGRPTSPDRILALTESGEGHINRQMLTLAWDHLRDVYPDLPPLSAFEAGAGGSGTGGSSAAMGPGGSASISHQGISRPTAAVGQRVGGSISSASQAAVGSSSVSQAQSKPNTRPRLSEAEIQDFYARVLGATQHPPPQQQAGITSPTAIRSPQQGQPRGDISAAQHPPSNVPPTTKRRHRHRSNSAPSHPSRGRLTSRSSHAYRLLSQQQRYMPQFPTNTRLSDRAQHRIVQDLLQSRRTGQLTRAEIHQDMRNLVEIGIRPNVLFDHYHIPADERRHYRNNILNRPITPVELNALPEPSSPGMDRDMQRTTWNRLRRKHYPNLPSPSTSPSAVASQRPMAIPHQPHAVRQQSPPRGGIGAIHPSPNVPPATRKRQRSNSVSSFSGGGPRLSKRGRFGRRKKRNAQFA